MGSHYVFLTVFIAEILVCHQQSTIKSKQREYDDKMILPHIIDHNMANIANIQISEKALIMNTLFWPLLLWQSKSDMILKVKIEQQ